VSASSGVNRAGLVMIGICTEQVPLAGLTVSFSPMLRIAPPPLGRLGAGRNGASALAGEPRSEPVEPSPGDTSVSPALCDWPCPEASRRHWSVPSRMHPISRRDRTARIGGITYICAPAGASLITAFIPTLSDTAFSSWSDDRLIGVVRDLVERLFSELRGHFRAGRLTRWSYGSHQGEVGYYTALQRFLDRYPADEPVQVAGDYLATSGQESAVVSGVNAANRIIAAHSDLATPAGTGQHLTADPHRQ
jgi:flavin-dependent amine oxidoreductase